MNNLKEHYRPTYLSIYHSLEGGLTNVQLQSIPLSKNHLPARQLKYSRLQKSCSKRTNSRKPQIIYNIIMNVIFSTQRRRKRSVTQYVCDTEANHHWGWVGLACEAIFWLVHIYLWFSTVRGLQQWLSTSCITNHCQLLNNPSQLLPEN